jgi:hypothetical protein
MGTLLTLLTLGAGLGGFGWWLTRRDENARGSREPDLRQPPLALPPPPSELEPEVLLEADAPPPDPNAPPPPRALSAQRPAIAAPALAPSDFVPRLRSWLERDPPATQIELVAVHLERAGHRETAAQLRALAHDRRHARAQVQRPERVAVDPRDPTSLLAPGGSSDLLPGPGSANLPNTGGGNVARSEPSALPEGVLPESAPPENAAQLVANAPMSEAQLQELARRVAAMLHAREGQPTDRRLVRQFQVAARLFPAHGENPSGLYGPATREALARYGVRNPPRPRFRAAVESAPPRPARNAPRPNAPEQNAQPPNAQNAPPPQPPNQRPNARPNARRPNARPNAQRPNSSRPNTPRPNPHPVDPGAQR